MPLSIFIDFTEIFLSSIVNFILLHQDLSYFRVEAMRPQFELGLQFCFLAADSSEYGEGSYDRLEFQIVFLVLQLILEVVGITLRLEAYHQRSVKQVA